MTFRMLTFAFWFSAAGIAYAYIGYPIILALLAWFFGCAKKPPTIAEGELPHVALVIAAHNEADVIAARVQNALDLDYPSDRLDIVIASDGSSDDTVAIARRVGGHRVRVLDYESRRGKAEVLNSAFQELRSGIVVLSDANTFTDASAIRRLVRWFKDQRVGIVCGKLVLTDPRTGQNVDSLYWKYETFLKICEDRLGSLLGANGAIYAIRRSLFTAIRRDTLIDDFVLPLLTRMRTGCALVYDREAIACEETPARISAEFRRRSRIGAGAFQSIPVLWRLLNPRQGWIAFTFLSHKILRWACPFFLLALLACNIALIPAGAVYQRLLVLQIALYAISAAGGLWRDGADVPRALRLTTLFATMNVALLVGFWWWMAGVRQGTWTRTAR